MESPPGNLLSGDPELLEMYLDALDTVLGTPDVRRSFDEFGLSAGILRIRMIRNADRVLRTAPREFAAYQNAVSRELSALARDPTVTRQRSLRNLVWRLRALAKRLVVRYAPPER